MFFAAAAPGRHHTHLTLLFIFELNRNLLGKKWSSAKKENRNKRSKKKEYEIHTHKYLFDPMFGLQWQARLINIAIAHICVPFNFN